jgi:hypothetical protein
MAWEEKTADGHVVHFDSMTDLRDYLSKSSTQDAQTDTLNSFRDGSYADAIKLTQTGWQTGTTEVMANLENIHMNLEEEPAGYYWSNTGQFFDVGAVLSGEPEHWMETNYEPTRRVVRVVANVAASGGINAKQLRLKGGVILALIDYLQREGCIVELDVVTGIDNGGDRRCYTIQHFGTTPLDWDAASFALAHGAYFRRLTWSALGIMLKKQYVGDSSCYEPSSIRKDPSIIYIPSGDLRRPDGQTVKNTTPEGMAEWVKAWAERAMTLTTME